MTDRADEIARELVWSLDDEWAKNAQYVTENDQVAVVITHLRAYGDECRNAALEEAAVKVRADCLMCDGVGGVPLGTHVVTREMAMDAGQPEREGEIYDEEWSECEYCGRPMQSIRALKEKP